MAKFDLTQFLEDVKEIVNIDSGTSDTEGVIKVGNIMKEKFRSLGSSWTVRDAKEADTKAPCIEVFNKDDKEFDVFLLGHIDTVFPHGTVEKLPYREAEDGNIYGAGVYDMKTSVMMIYYVLKMLQEEGKLDKLSVCVGLNSEEEVGSRSTQEWIESIAKRSKYVICCEPARAGGEMVIERKGLGKLKIEIHGKAVHAGVNPWDGVSAIHILAHWTTELATMNDYEGGTSLNMGKINGGIGVNTVADYAVGELDIRVEDLKAFDKIMEKVEELKAWTKEKNATAEVTGGIARPPMKPTEKSYEFADIVNKIAPKYNIKPVWIKTGGGSDANFTAALGVPTIDGMGPAGAHSHTDHEYTIKSKIEPYVMMTKDTIEELSKKLHG